MKLRKDKSLDELARVGNVAQFVSYSPGRVRPHQEFSRVAGFDANHQFQNISEGLRVLLDRCPEGTLNLRSFTPDNPRSRDFHYGLADLAQIEALVCKMSGEGLYVIANETVDVADGGVSGVIQGGVVEFAPDDTPRCVEKGGTASMSLGWGLSLLKTVYSFPVETVDAGRGRLEFSIHLKPRGWRRGHTLMWEYEASDSAPAMAALKWPNRFSRLIGDKTFGLLVADLIGLPVPRTTCISRRIAPFSFGQPTFSNEVWIRTCPREQEPGKFTTAKGWLDPFRLLAEEDPTGEAISAVLCQSAVPAAFAGAAIMDAEKRIVIEGTSGEGDSFMVGKRLPERLPENVLHDIRETYHLAEKKLGPVRFEWVHDGTRVWIVQLHKGATDSSASTLVPGEADQWEVFDVSSGLEELRRLLARLPADVGLQIRGDVGLTSHVADLLRKARRPARLQPQS
ncbi:MAG: hypothetical protein E6614_04525 [Bradyrhizobium sp.]|jgi:hypothetical protein|nr:MULTISPECIES: hypothetical protein [unclassified Bradyrhizobium]MDU1498011.1 hypothetical protein [Bradyrhizobium sp.]MDU1548260.1 hypothetical protein [Bradyrhizobium sp.]MDU1666582.1 hypothetical protein [Bradyrhizobium sp.]MDU1688530.1 hypothetical protein [Bradyrhizobium sp.]MDU1807594.1 hypothetical protein [Bradyrhizobium sp.]